MSVFKSEKFVPITVADLEPVARELASHFQQRNYQVECTPVAPDQWEVGITRGGAFKKAVGLKSALKVRLEPRPAGTMIRAGAGIFGKQAIPTAITLLVAWPVVLTQVWGIIREAGLDDEAVKVVEMILERNQRLRASTAGTSGHAGSRVPDSVPNAPAASAGAKPFTAAASTLRSSQAGGPAPEEFCANCGRQLEADAQFCPTCGKARPHESSSASAA